MKMPALALSLVAWSLIPKAHAGESTPITKVLQLLSDLEAKIIAEGEAAQKVYIEFAEWCEDRSKDLRYEIKTGNSEIAALKATIEQETALTGSLNAKVEKLSGEVAVDESDLKAAIAIRAMENSAFVAEETELSEVVDTLKRAIAILTREMAKSGASMLQLKNVNSVAQALAAMVQASMLSSADGQRLTALVQSSQESQDNEDDVNAPDPAVYKGHSGDIIATLEDLLEKAEAQLDHARKTETANFHNFQLLRQSIEDEIKFGKADLAAAQKGIAESAGKLATAGGDLKVTTSDLNTDVSTLADLHQNCMTKAQDHEAATKSRDEELKALAEAKRVIAEETGGANTVTYGLNQVSFFQLSSGADLANYEVARLVRDLSQKTHSSALSLLASRIASLIRSSTSVGDDPFAKVKGLIADMIARLEAEAEADATHKAYCDKELAETRAKKEDKEAEIAKLSTKIDQMSTRSAQLKQEVAALQKALAELASAQAEMDKLREEEHAVFVQEKADLEQGLEGVKLALKILREYYAKEDKKHEAAQGAGEGVIGLLEVAESDFSKTLAEIVATEASAASTYTQQTKDNQIEKTAKSQDVKYKSKESADLDKAVAGASADRSGVQTELDAVNEYLDSLLKQCTAVPETYAQREQRRAAEIAGLKQALSILEGEASLIQQNARRGLRRRSKVA